jgi:hypothetical protein
MSSSGREQFNMGGGVKTLGPVLDPNNFGSVGNSGRGVSAQAVMLVLVVAVSGGLLFAMRTIGKKSSIDFSAASYEDFQPDSKLQSDYERVMASLTSVQDPLDVALADLSRSPFAFRAADAPIPTPDNPRPLATPQGESPEQAATRRSAARKAALAAELTKLTLHSVLGGKRPIARINDETLTVGDMVADQFLVVSIDGRSVTLSADGQNYVISMDQTGQMNPGAQPAGRKR